MRTPPSVSPLRARVFLVSGILFLVAIAAALTIVFRWVSGSALTVTLAIGLVYAFAGMGLIRWIRFRP